MDIYEEQKKLINTTAWDGEWFRRCITDEGRFIGSKSEPQAKIWLNVQSWAVLSGMGDKEKQISAMDSVAEYLDTELGIKKIDLSMKDYPSKADPLTYYHTDSERTEVCSVMQILGQSLPSVYSNVRKRRTSIITSCYRWQYVVCDPQSRKGV